MKEYWIIQIAGQAYLQFCFNNGRYTALIGDINLAYAYESESDAQSDADKIQDAKPIKVIRGTDFL